MVIREGPTLDSKVNKVVSEMEEAQAVYDRDSEVIEKEIAKAIGDIGSLWSTYLGCIDGALVAKVEPDSIPLYSINLHQGLIPKKVNEIYAFMVYGADPLEEVKATMGIPSKLENSGEIRIKYMDEDLGVGRDEALFCESLPIEPQSGEGDIWQEFLKETLKVCNATYSHKKVLEGLEKAQTRIKELTLGAATNRRIYVKGRISE